MIIDGNRLAKDINHATAMRITMLSRSPRFVAINIGDNKENRLYLKKKQILCSNVGIDMTVVSFDTDSDEVLPMIRSLSNDDNIDGIMVQLPVPGNLVNIIEQIDPAKDVDGMHPYNIGRLFMAKADPSLFQDGCFPCTALAVYYILHHYQVDLSGRRVVVVGQGLIAGSPISQILINAGATVTMCHDKTVDLDIEVSRADVLISATGVKHLIKSDWTRQTGFIVDVGICKEKRKVFGDIESTECVGFITPVPGGIGPITVAMLANNILEVCRRKLS